jgi:ATP-dependent DNA ligase
VKAKDFSTLPSAKVRFVEPMYALAVQKLPQGKEWLYEVKFDGYRRLAGRDQISSQASSHTSPVPVSGCHVIRL